MYTHMNFTLALALGLLFQANAMVTTYPAPIGSGAIPLSKDYIVYADDQRVDVYTQASIHGGAYSYAYFDFSGAVTIRIVSKQNLSSVKVLPPSFNIPIAQQGDTLTLTLNAPRNFSVEPNSINAPLILFANPIQQNPPKQGDPGVLFYGPGVHNGSVTVGANQTLYLAGGAVLNGYVTMGGNNSTLLGRGIIFGGGVGTASVKRVLLNGVILANCPNWSVHPSPGTDSLTIDNLKILNSQKLNEDGIDICSTSDVVITNSFIRTDDDNIAIKGTDHSNYTNAQNIRINDCVFWCDRARIFAIGCESWARYQRDVAVQNIDVIHFSMVPFYFMPALDMVQQNFLFENVRLINQGTKDLVLLNPNEDPWSGLPANAGPGYIKQITFRDVSVSGTQGGVNIKVLGNTATHDVEDATFERVTYNGQCLTANALGVQVNGFTKNIRFLCDPIAINKSPSDSPRAEGMSVSLLLNISGSVAAKFMLRPNANQYSLTVSDMKGGLLYATGRRVPDGSVADEKVFWDGRTRGGLKARPGVYSVTCRSNNSTQTRVLSIME